MALLRPLLIALMASLLPVQASAQATTQESGIEHLARKVEQIEEVEISPIQTESPRSTIRTFYRLRDELETSMWDYWQQQNTSNAAQITFVMGQMRALIDLSKLPVASRRETGSETALYLLDILGRVKTIDATNLPGTDELDDQALNGHRLTGTPLRIVETTEGDRAGEYLFSPDTIRSAPRFFRGIEKRRLRSTLPMDSWYELGHQLAGPWIPLKQIEALPDILKRPLLNTPIWKIILVLILSMATGFILHAWHRFLTKWFTDDPVAIVRLKTLSPVAIMIALLGLRYVFSFQINTSGRFFDLTETLMIALFYVAATWAFWAAVRVFFETILIDPRLGTRNLDDSFIGLVGKIVGVIGGILILGFGANELGVPILSMIAGLGIGGIAVALAARPTLENLIGGFILFLDKPVRVGDYCTFGDQSGTVEDIGIPFNSAARDRSHTDFHPQCSVCRHADRQLGEMRHDADTRYAGASF